MKLGEFIGSCTMTGADPKQTMAAIADYYEKQLNRVRTVSASVSNYISTGTWEDINPACTYININGVPYTVEEVGTKVKSTYDAYFDNYGSNTTDIYNTNITCTDIDGVSKTFKYKDFEDALSAAVDSSYINNILTQQFSNWFVDGVDWDNLSTQSANIMSQFVNKDASVIEQVNKVLKAVKEAGADLSSKVQTLAQLLGLGRIDTLTESNYANNFKIDFITQDEISAHTGINPLAGLVSGLDFTNLGTTIVSTYDMIWRIRIQSIYQIGKFIVTGVSKLFNKVGTYLGETLVNPVDFEVDGDYCQHYELPTRYHADKFYIPIGEQLLSSDIANLILPDGTSTIAKLNDGDYYFSIFGCSFRLSRDRNNPNAVNVFSYIKPKDIRLLAANIRMFLTSFKDDAALSGWINDQDNVLTTPGSWSNLTLGQAQTILSAFSLPFDLRADRTDETQLEYDTRVTKAWSCDMLHSFFMLFARLNELCCQPSSTISLATVLNSEFSSDTTLGQLNSHFNFNLIDSIGKLIQDISYNVWQLNNTTSSLAQAELFGQYPGGVGGFQYLAARTTSFAIINNKDLLLNYSATPMVSITPGSNLFSADFRYDATYQTSENWSNFHGGLVIDSNYTSNYGWNNTGTSNTVVPIEQEIIGLWHCLLSFRMLDGCNFFLIPYSRFNHIQSNITIKTDSQNIAAVDKMFFTVAVAAIIIAASIYIGKSVIKFKNQLTTQSAFLTQLEWKLGEAVFASGGASTTAVNNYTKEVLKSRRKLRLMSRLGGILGISAVSAAYEASDTTLPVLTNSNVNIEGIEGSLSNIEDLIH